LKRLRDARSQAQALKARIEDLEENTRRREEARANRPILKRG
jgi:hypothetical protein